MKTLRKVTIKPEFVKSVPENKQMQQDVVYISLIHATMVHLCLCGCGNESVTPIGENGWGLSMVEENREKIITITPSILNRNCPNHCHYIITKNIANIV